MQSAALLDSVAVGQSVACKVSQHRSASASVPSKKRGCKFRDGSLIESGVQGHANIVEVFAAGASNDARYYFLAGRHIQHGICMFVNYRRRILSVSTISNRHFPRGNYARRVHGNSSYGLGSEPELLDIYSRAALRSS